uniref:Small ribosomal subunit protein uS3c n=1 Tax=Monomastix sp. (strain OKE-1) TaxID=141716 RepID=C0JWQ0_MONSK|nr:ribosomal protein S3 [Monomastix sp. OKE-1]ACK36907.1 ribosomal protein S3 [Monomastix sp. OKE-1]
MGQKIHPLGLRIGIFQKHKSEWFAPVGSSNSNQSIPNYAAFIEQDKGVRDFFSSELRDAGLSKILISRRTNRLFVELHVAQPKLVLGENGNNLKQLTEKFQKNIQKLLSRHNNPSMSAPALSIQVVQIPQEEIATDATLLGQKIAEQLEKRVAFRRVMKQSIQQARAAGAEGIKIQIAGRLNGAEIARTEWAREGRVPLQTLKANIDYCYETAQTIYGILGIKIWIFKGTNTSRV